MKEIIAVSCCPWCKKLPTFQMYMHRETWLPELRCINEKCSVKPVSKYVPIRKRQRYIGREIGARIHKMINMWNQDHPYKPAEGFEFDFDEVASKERERSGITLLSIQGRE